MGAPQQEAPSTVPDSHPVGYCVGASAYGGSVENRESTWADFVQWLTTNPQRLEFKAHPDDEARWLSVEEYHALPEAEQKAAKDGDVFVTGLSLDGRRGGDSFSHRSMLYLDIDKPAEGYEPDVNKAALTSLWKGECPVLGDTEYLVHLTTSSLPHYLKAHVLVPLREPLPVEDQQLANEGLLLALEAAHEGLAADRSGLSRVRPLYRPKLARLVTGIHAKRNRGGFPDVDRFIAIAVEHRAAEVKAKGAKRRHAYDDADAVKGRWREILDGLGVYTEPIRRSAANSHSLASTCPACRSDVARVDWTDSGLWVCRACPPGVGGTIVDFVVTLENTDVAGAFARCRELLGFPSGKSHQTAEDTSVEEDWLEPEPIAPPLLPVPAFDAEVLLPDALRDWVVGEASRMRCPIEFIAGAVLVSLGSVVGARVALRPKSRDESWLVVPNLWGGVVGRPSTMKTPSLTAALSPLGRLSANAREAFDEAMVGYEPKAKEFAAREAALEKELRSAAEADIREAVQNPVITANAAAEGRKSEGAKKTESLGRMGQEAPVAPVLRRYRSNDSTIAQLGELLRDNPQGFLVFRDELCGLLDRWESRDGQEDRTFFLEAWNGKSSFDVDRVGRGHVHIPNLCLAILGGIQPERLLACLVAQKGRNDGLLQRFGVLLYPDETSWGWTNDELRPGTQEAVYGLFETLADFEPEAWGARPPTLNAKFPTVQFDEEAQGVFVEWVTELRTKRIPSEPSPMLQEHLGKYDGLFCQIALIWHCVERAAGASHSEVSASAALAAAAWCELLEAHARRCYGMLEHVGQEGAYSLSKRIAAGDLESGFTVRDVRRKQWRNLTSTPAVDDAVDVLILREWIRPFPTGGSGPGGGRATVKYAVNPAVRGGVA